MSPICSASTFAAVDRDPVGHQHAGHGRTDLTGRLDEIKRRFPDLPVMMVTAYGDDERRRRAGELGAAEFITKPVDFDQLKAQLRRLPAAAD
jgi:DNA-binding NtrC family response regulator